jgi:hypothetical protein
MCELERKIGALLVEYKFACEIKRNKLPNEILLQMIKNGTKEMEEELQALKSKWGLLRY